MKKNEKEWNKMLIYYEREGLLVPITYDHNERILISELKQKLKSEVGLDEFEITDFEGTVLKDIFYLSDYYITSDAKFFCV